MFGDHFFVKIIERIGEPSAFKELIFFFFLELKNSRFLGSPDIVQIDCGNQIPSMVSGFILN